MFQCVIGMKLYLFPVMKVWARITTSRPVVDRIDSWTAKLRNVSVQTYLQNYILKETITWF